MCCCQFFARCRLAGAQNLNLSRTVAVLSGTVTFCLCTDSACSVRKLTELMVMLLDLSAIMTTDTAAFLGKERIMGRISDN